MVTPSACSLDRYVSPQNVPRVAVCNAQRRCARTIPCLSRDDEIKASHSARYRRVPCMRGRHPLARDVRRRSSWSRLTRSRQRLPAGRRRNALPAQRNAGKKIPTPSSVAGIERPRKACGHEEGDTLHQCKTVARHRFTPTPCPIPPFMRQSAAKNEKSLLARNASRQENGSAFEARGLSMEDNGTGRKNLSRDRKLRNITSTGYGHPVSRRGSVDENRRHSDAILSLATPAVRQPYEAPPRIARSDPTRPSNQPRMANFGSESTQRALFIAGESCTS